MSARLAGSNATSSSRPLQLAIYNQVDFHLHVVAGAMRVLRPLTSSRVTVFVSTRVLQEDAYGFMSWLGQEPGFCFRDCAEYDDTAACSREHFE